MGGKKRYGSMYGGIVERRMRREARRKLELGCSAVEEKERSGLEGWRKRGKDGGESGKDQRKLMEKKGKIYSVWKFLQP